MDRIENERVRDLGKEHQMNQSETLFQEAVTVMPGGVNSPVRAFGSVGTMEHVDGISNQVKQYYQLSLFG